MELEEAEQKIGAFITMLGDEEKAASTVRKYAGDVRIFLAWCRKSGIGTITQRTLKAYKESLCARRKLSGCNSVIISLNKFFGMFAEERLRLKSIPRQRKTSLDEIFSPGEYRLLLERAKDCGSERLYFIMRLLASSGIRVGELAFITVGVLESGRCVVRNKGKSRDIFIPSELCEELKGYCTRHGIRQGVVFRSKRHPDRMLDKSQIWREMDRLGKAAGLPKGCVHAHSFRHFFAKQYYQKYKDLCELADILGHSSIETTRIYTRSTTSEKMERIAGLHL